MARVLTTALLFAATACGDSSDPGEMVDTSPPTAQADATITVEYQDSSVPPEYHRSWTLEANKKSITLVVDSYGKVVARERVTMPKNLWREFRRDLWHPLYDIPEPVDAGVDACAGGTGVELVIENAGREFDETLRGSSSCTDETAVNEEIQTKILTLVRPFTDRVNLKKHTRTA